MKNKMSDLRNHLFETIERLKDGDQTMDLDRARTISEVASTIIASAKVEVDFIKSTGAELTPEFLEDTKPQLATVPHARLRA